MLPWLDLPAATLYIKNSFLWRLGIEAKAFPVACFQCEPPLYNSNEGVSILTRVVYVSVLGSFFSLFLYAICYTQVMYNVLAQVLVSFHITDITKMYVQCPTQWCGGIFHAGRGK